MTSNQGAPKGADVVGERARLRDRAIREVEAARGAGEGADPEVIDALCDALATAEARLEVYREALDGLYEAALDADWFGPKMEKARAALREKP